MQIFFSSRQAMRSVKFGKAQDSGPESSKRWSRHIDVSRSTDKRISFASGVKVVTIRSSKALLPCVVK